MSYLIARRALRHPHSVAYRVALGLLGGRADVPTIIVDGGGDMPPPQAPPGSVITAHTDVADTGGKVVVVPLPGGGQTTVAVPKDADQATVQEIVNTQLASDAEAKAAVEAAFQALLAKVSMPADPGEPKPWMGTKGVVAFPSPPGVSGGPYDERRWAQWVRIKKVFNLGLKPPPPEPQHYVSMMTSPLVTTPLWSRWQNYASHYSPLLAAQPDPSPGLDPGRPWFQSIETPNDLQGGTEAKDQAISDRPTLATQIRATYDAWYGLFAAAKAAGHVVGSIRGPDATGMYWIRREDGTYAGPVSKEMADAIASGQQRAGLDKDIDALVAQDTAMRNAAAAAAGSSIPSWAIIGGAGILAVIILLKKKKGPTP